MISIETASNGFIVHVDDERTLVFQQEYDSMNLALGSVLKMIVNELEHDEHIRIKIDIEGK